MTDMCVFVSMHDTGTYTWIDPRHEPAIGLDRAKGESHQRGNTVLNKLTELLGLTLLRVGVRDSRFLILMNEDTIRLLRYYKLLVR